MDTRRASVTVNESEGKEDEGTGVDGGVVGVGGGGGGSGGGAPTPGRNRAANEVGGRANGVGELTKRRHANDPAMMRELKRYQRLMLLTILPSISGEGDHPHLHPHAHAHHPDAEISPTRQSPRTSLTSDGSSNKSTEVDKNHNDHLPRPEPKDGITGVGQQNPSVRNTQHQAKSAGTQRARAGKPPNAGSSSAGTRLPLTVYNPLNNSPTKKTHRRKSQDEGHHRRKKSQGDKPPKDEGREVAEKGSSGDSSGAGSVLGGTNGSGGGGVGELDLLTLAALYLESRHRVFGQEWHYRPENAANIRPGVQVGTAGMARPRRLSPLSSNDGSSAEHVDDSRHLEHRRSFSGVIPAPAGLHLSVNYTQNLDLDESSIYAERARAMKPRLRRLNSMEDLIVSPLDSSQQSLHRATSAPDLSQSAHARHLYAERVRHESQLSLDSISPPLVTPARANTPTGTLNSAAMARPQIVGESLATSSSARDVSKPFQTLGGRHSGRASNTRARSMSEGSRHHVLQPPPRTSRLLGMPPEQRMMELPRAPPPSAAVENPRKNGRIHLEPLTLRKTSN